MMMTVIFGNYDIANAKDAKLFLLDTLSKELKEHIKLRMDDGDAFVILWLHLMAIDFSTLSIKNGGND